MAGKTLSAARLHFHRLLIDFLAKNGVVDVGTLYDPPFTSVSPGGPENLFPSADVDAIEEVLKRVRTTEIPGEPMAR